MYKSFIKRLFDVILSLIGIIILSPLMLILALLVRIKLGKPVLFGQKRPGKNMEIKKYYKFRSMTDKKDKEGILLDDEIRLTAFGKKLRSTSLDELPQLFDILFGKMSIVGPRPQTIENIMFMNDKQKERQNIIPGLTGWAQVNGRNNTTWDERIEYDLEYIEKQSFLFDLKIMFKTVSLVLSHDNVSQKTGNVQNVTFETMGIYLVRTGQITQEEYEKQRIIIKNTYY
ncbi:MAG: sugar transferase [Spirochaetaceae bacterium]|nr:sugar transferase [Spirochaetaceae bacterium]